MSTVGGGRELRGSRGLSSESGPLSHRQSGGWGNWPDGVLAVWGLGADLTLSDAITENSLIV